VLGSIDRVMIIRGKAGTGKTTLEQEIGEALAEAGKPVVALAQSVKASREVLRQEAGFPNADTVAMFLTDAKMQETARGGVILVDEASQLGTRDMLKLFEVGKGLKARILLVGDKNQHRSVTAGEPLRLLEERSGVPVAEVTEILRQQGDYKKVAGLLSEGRTEEAFEELDKLGWIKQVSDSDRDKQLAAAYLAAVSERKRSGEYKSALVVSPTHAEGDRTTQAIRDGLKAEGRLGTERMVNAWVPTHLTDPQKTDATEYEPGDLIQFHQNAKGHTKGTRLIVGEGVAPPTELAQGYEVYRPVQLALGVGDRVRITAGGKAKDGRKFSNGSLFTVQGFNRRGDILVDGGRVIDRDFGHLTHGYVLTSHASQGDTVDTVFAAISSQSFPATNQRTGAVALTRGRERVVIFTDDRKELLKALSRPDDPMSATELAGSAEQTPTLLDRLKKLAFTRNMAAAQRDRTHNRGLDHAG
jgi:ATP-dependent exoDNAse (exonuclease V) alpha subunit